MTEDEARTKWCPMVRASRVTPNGQAEGFNYLSTPDTQEHYGHCIASDCMMWHPERRQIQQTSEGQNIGVVWGGYCGLAGKP